jgi:hypothetical protein
MRDQQLAIQVVRATVLLDAGVEVDLDGLLLGLLETQLINRAAERLINLEHDGGGERSIVLDNKVLSDRVGRDVLLPDVLEVKLGWDRASFFALLLHSIEHQGRGDEVTKHVKSPNWLRFALSTSHDLTLPDFRDLASLEGISSELDHDSHLRVESDLLRDDGVDELNLFFLFRSS